MAIGEHSIDSSISVCVALACCSRAKWINQRPEERAASIQFDPIRSDPPGRNRAEPRWMCSSQLLCFGSLLRSALFCFVLFRLASLLAANSLNGFPILFHANHAKFRPINMIRANQFNQIPFNLAIFIAIASAIATGCADS